MIGATMKECKLCRRLVSSSTGRVCQDCYKYLDEIYPTVRSYIRDSKNPQLDVTEISDALTIPLRYVQGLVDCGYLGRDLPNAPVTDSTGNEDKDKLAQELQKATTQLRANASRKQSSVTYGQERYTTKK